MSESTAPRVGFGRRLGKAGVRLYALLLMLIVGYLVYLAFAFLFTSVFWPRLTPGYFVSRPLRLTGDEIREWSRVGGEVRKIEGAPLNHYHGLGHVTFTRPESGCTTSGCHAPLPHVRNKSSRAFANFHGAFMDCAMCHHAKLVSPTPACWVDVHTGKPRETPALLQLVRLFANHHDKAIAGDRELDARLRVLVRNLAAVAHNDPLIVYIRDQLTTSQRGSPVYMVTLAQLRVELPNQDRGEYSAVIAPEPLGERSWIGNEAYNTRVLERLAIPSHDPDGASAQNALHGDVLAEPRACLECHGSTPSRIDYEALGYPAARAAFLRSMPLARVAQQVRDGQPFHLPSLLNVQPEP